MLYPFPRHPERIEAGKRLSCISQRKDIEKRKNGGKILKVCLRPDGDSYTASIRIQGKWLQEFGFILNDLVKIQAYHAQIVISKI